MFGTLFTLPSIQVLVVNANQHISQCSLERNYSSDTALVNLFADGDVEAS